MSSNDNIKHRPERTMAGRSVTVNHSSRYLCRHESSDGVRTHHAPADHRYRVGPSGHRWPLCEMHADQWRQLGYLASRPGPQEPHRRATTHTTWGGWPLQPTA